MYHDKLVQSQIRYSHIRKAYHRYAQNTLTLGTVLLQTLINVNACRVTESCEPEDLSS